MSKRKKARDYLRTDSGNAEMLAAFYGSSVGSFGARGRNAGLRTPKA